MTYLGKVTGGVVVIEGDEKPQEGTLVRIEAVSAAAGDESIIDSLLKLAGTIERPPDASVNVDHYLYGLPKK